MATLSEEIVDVNFEAYPPYDNDIPGIVMLLKQLFGGNESLNIGKLVELFVAQNYIGCVLKEEEELDNERDDEALDLTDEETIYAYTSVLNLTTKKDVPCVAQLKKYLKEKAKGTPGEGRIKSVLGDPAAGDNVISTDIGLIINERMINLPCIVCVPMLESMLNDMEAKSKMGMPFVFSHYIMISKMYRLIDPPKTMHYVYPEDELWDEYMEKDMFATFDYQMSSETDTLLVEGGSKSKPITATLWRRVRVFTAPVLLKLIELLKTKTE